MGLPEGACLFKTSARFQNQPQAGLSNDEGKWPAGEGEVLQTGATLEEEASSREAESIYGCVGVKDNFNSSQRQRQQGTHQNNLYKTHVCIAQSFWGQSGKRECRI